MTIDLDLTGCVVAGYDGSPGSELALEWACHHARLEKRGLVVIHAAGPSLVSREPVTVGGRELRHASRHDRMLLEDVSRRLDRSAADVDVRTVHHRDGARAALVEASHQAAVVVVGATSRRAVTSMVLGTVAQAVADEATCPVVVVRRQPSISVHSVLVGTDGTSISEPALAFAFEVAAARSWPLTVLHCFWDVTRSTGDVPDDEPGHEAERDQLWSTVQPHLVRHPDLQVEVRLSRGFADRRLIMATHDHGLVVVGHHKLPVLDAVVWGNVTPLVVHQASGDIAVVPAARTDEARGAV